MMKFTQSGYQLKEVIIHKAKELGADMVGFAPVERWPEYQQTRPEFYPQNIWPESKTVIVLGVQIFLPMLETTPSIVYSELYNTANRVLDDMAYKLANFLNHQGHYTVFFPRDGYGSISVLVEKPEAAFSHVLAGKYAGLGTIGYNHTLLTREYGPRVRFASVITGKALPPDEVIHEELCIKCEVCKRCCPTAAFTTTHHLIAEMDKTKCAEHHAKLRAAYRYPCGVCIKVCPVGEDRNIYGQNEDKYLNEIPKIASHSDISAYSGWIHCRNFGSKELDNK